MEVVVIGAAAIVASTFIGDDVWQLRYSKPQRRYETAFHMQHKEFLKSYEVKFRTYDETPIDQLLDLSDKIQNADQLLENKHTNDALLKNTNHEDQFAEKLHYGRDNPSKNTHTLDELPENESSIDEMSAYKASKNTNIEDRLPVNEPPVINVISADKSEIVHQLPANELVSSNIPGHESDTLAVEVARNENAGNENKDDFLPLTLDRELTNKMLQQCTIQHGDKWSPRIKKSNLKNYKPQIEIHYFKFRRLSVKYKPFRVQMIRCSEKYALIADDENSLSGYVLMKSKNDKKIDGFTFHIYTEFDTTKKRSNTEMKDGQSSLHGQTTSSLNTSARWLSLKKSKSYHESMFHRSRSSSQRKDQQEDGQSFLYSQPYNDRGTDESLLDTSDHQGTLRKSKTQRENIGNMFSRSRSSSKKKDRQEDGQSSQTSNGGDEDSLPDTSTHQVSLGKSKTYRESIGNMFNRSRSSSRKKEREKDGQYAKYSRISNGGDEESLHDTSNQQISFKKSKTYRERISNMFNASSSSQKKDRQKGGQSSLYSQTSNGGNEESSPDTSDRRGSLKKTKTYRSLPDTSDRRGSHRSRSRSSSQKRDEQRDDHSSILSQRSNRKNETFYDKLLNARDFLLKRRPNRKAPAM